MSRGNPSSSRQVSDLTPPSMSTPRPSEADVEVVLSADEVNAMTGDDIRFWIDNPFMTPDLITEKVCYWVTRSLAARDAEHERDVAALRAEVDEWRKATHDTRAWATSELAKADARAEAAERALADLRGEIKALAFSLDRGDSIDRSMDDAAGAGGAE